MQPEKWQNIRGQIQDTFKDVQITKESLFEPEVGERETVLFVGPLGRMKLEYTTRPMVTDKITHGSRRMGSEATVTYVYSPNEFSHTLKAFKWDDLPDDWVEIDLKGSFNLN